MRCGRRKDTPARADAHAHHLANEISPFLCANVEYGAYDELGAYDKHGSYCENDANGEYGAYALHMLNIMKVIQMCKLYILMQVITSPGQVRAGRVRNAKLGVEKLIEEHLPSSLSEYILFETVL